MRTKPPRWSERSGEAMSDEQASSRLYAPATVATRERDRLRFVTCGSVEGGKSTLIGRLLYDSALVLEDHLAEVARDSPRYDTTGDDCDLALLMDGLEAGREQGITIDVAWRTFATEGRAFTVADVPGHEQYTRNMATGASNAELAVILVDARKGAVVQTRRHATIASLFGIRQAVLAINKIDLVDYDERVFNRIVAEFSEFSAHLAFDAVVAIPISARYGDNVRQRSRKTPWYRGPTLLEHLEAVDVASIRKEKPFRFAVQWVNRPSHDFRGLAGTIASGRVRRGDAVVVAESGTASRIARIIGPDGDVDEASAGDAVTLTLADEIDVSRGDLLVSAKARPEVADQFAAHVLWTGQEPLLAGRPYLMRIGTRWTPVTVTAIKHKLDMHALEPLAARTLALNEIGTCNLATATPVAFDAYADNRETGAFILVDRFNDQTVAAGMIEFALRRAANIHRERLSVDKGARASQKAQRPCILWFTGLPAAGKSTIAKLVEARLHAFGHHSYMLDGDNLRHGLTHDLGFTDADRVENIRRVGEVAKLFVDAGLIVLCSFISPFRAERRMVRALVEADEFIEIYIDTPLAECIRRDPKGLYAKAQAGTVTNFTGFDSPYEPPQAAELVLATMMASPEELADRVVDKLKAAGRI
jgi:bifunctional enzyme CysN/CysC